MISPSSFFAIRTRRVAIPGTLTLLRPNNVTAYAAGGVWGTAADGRLLFPALPALPADAAYTSFDSLQFLLTETRPGADVTLPAISIFLNAGAFATVLADQVQIALSDAEIATLIRSTNGAFSFAGFPTGAGQNWAHNNSAGLAGRRAATQSLTPIQRDILQPGLQVGMYIVVGAAYVPIALESLTVTDIIANYTAKVR